MEDQFFDAIITDPPYSSGGLHRAERTQGAGDKYRRAIDILEPNFDGDQRDQRAWIMWCTLWLEECYRVSRRGAYVAICTDWRQLPALSDAIQGAGWTWGGIVPWDKGLGGARPQLGWLRQRCEFVLFARKGNFSDAADARRVDVTLDAMYCGRAPSVAGGRWHMTEKPVGLMAHLCGLVRPGGRVLDPFLGSGTTLVACRQLGLVGYGIEQEAQYCERIRERLAQVELLSHPSTSTPEPAPPTKEDPQSLLL